MRGSLSVFAVGLIVTALLGVDINLTDSQLEPRDEAGNPFRDRDAPERYIHDVTEVCDLLVEEIASHLSQDQAEALRVRHYDWKVSRDAPCASPEALSTNDLAELECIAARVETWYSELELMAEKLIPPDSPSKLPAPPE